MLELVESIPRGNVVSYGDIAALLGWGEPRQVGWVMAHYGGAVPWWHVVRADGSPPPRLAAAALRYFRAEGTPLRPGGNRADMARPRPARD